MDYALDYVLEINEPDVPVVHQRVSFTYDDSRFFSKTYAGLKLLGVVVYAGTLSSCTASSLYFYMSMLCVMAMSAANSVRYEYCHYKRYGTSFYSAEEFIAWKKTLWSRSRLFFSVTELAIKIGYFIYTFPPEFDFINRCTLGESIFKLHILALTLIYLVSGGITACLLLSFYCCNTMSRGHPHRHPPHRHPPHRHPHRHQHIVIHLIPAVIPIQSPIQDGLQDECCICLERAAESTLPWSMLVCGHKFHTVCVSTWLANHKTCPICRTSYNE